MKPNLLNSVKMQRPKKNRFDLTHDVKLSANIGELTPVCVLDCIPGDSYNISGESLIRFAPLVSPVMHRLDVTFHYFFVPKRILWPNWEKWITNTPNVGTGELPLHPTFQANTTTYTRLLDYMGIPGPIGIEEETINPMALAAYACIYDNYYRDQNLIPETNWILADGDNSTNIDLRELRFRAWEHDYFTSALPFAQKGEAVDIPLGTVELVDPETGGAGRLVDNTDYGIGMTGAVTGIVGGNLATGGNLSVYDPNGTLQVEPTTINSLRLATRLQTWLEKNARGGTRLVEFLKVHFGIKNQDARLQRPEYITGSKSPVQISEVLNTTGTDDLPQGNMAGHAISVTTGKLGHYNVQEHGYIIGIMSVLPRTAYQQGMPKHWLKYKHPTQHFFPDFAHLGEQPIERREIYSYQGTIPGNETFGYVPRFTEYKLEPSRVCGDFKASLDFWHLGRIFAAPPNLNQEFIQCIPDDNTRVFAVEDPSSQKLYCHVLNRISAIRPMPVFGTPTF